MSCVAICISMPFCRDDSCRQTYGIVAVQLLGRHDGPASLAKLRSFGDGNILRRTLLPLLGHCGCRPRSMAVVRE